MTKRDFFIPVIKLFVVMYIVASLFSVLPSNISIALMDIDAFSLTLIIVAVLIVIGQFVLLVFKSDKVVELQKPDKGFDDDIIELGNINSVDIVKIGSFIIGALLILDNITAFLSHTLFAFKGSVVGQVYGTQDKLYRAVNRWNLDLGCLLIINYDFMAKLLKTTKNN